MGEPGRGMSSFVVVTTIFGADCHLLVRENSGRDALASQLLYSGNGRFCIQTTDGYVFTQGTAVHPDDLLPNLRDGLLLTLTIYFPFPAEQLCVVVKLFAQQPLLRCFRLLVIFQDIRNGLIDHRQKQALCCLRMELASLVCHVGRPFPLLSSRTSSHSFGSTGKPNKAGR